jgi:hypothetical protein
MHISMMKCRTIRRYELFFHGTPLRKTLHLSTEVTQGESPLRKPYQGACVCVEEI